jgi:hypothetical protein
MLAKDKSIDNVKQIYLILIKDNSTEVRSKSLLHMNEVFRFFKYSSDTRQDTEFFSQISQALVKHSQCISRDWRMVESFYGNFKHFDEYFTTEEIQTIYIPMLKNQIFKGYLPVKIKAIEAIVIMARGLKSILLQTEIFRDIGTTLLRDKSYWNRLIFLELSGMIIKHFSRHFFKEYFFSDVLGLAKDSVPNVRRRFCYILPHMKQALELPADVQLLADLKESISYLLLDKDRDVVEAAQAAHDELTTIDSEISRGHKLNLMSRADVFDKQKQKEEEEWRITVSNYKFIRNLLTIIY